MRRRREYIPIPNELLHARVTLWFFIVAITLFFFIALSGGAVAAEEEERRSALELVIEAKQASVCFFIVRVGLEKDVYKTDSERMTAIAIAGFFQQLVNRNSSELTAAGVPYPAQLLYQDGVASFRALMAEAERIGELDEHYAYTKQTCDDIYQQYNGISL